MTFFLEKAIVVPYITFKKSLAGWLVLCLIDFDPRTQKLHRCRWHGDYLFFKECDHAHEHCQFLFRFINSFN